MSEFRICFDPLDEGVVKEQGVAPCWQLIFAGGHKSNSLDAIMAPAKKEGKKAMENRIEAIAAKGGTAFTVTFTDSYLNKYKDKYLENEIRQLTKKTKGVTDFEFVAEYSKVGRFHMHGVVLVKDVKVLANLRRKYGKFGICKVKAINNTQGWAEYCVKNIST